MSARPIRLLCLPHAGGSAALYGPWRQLLPSSIELCPIELPGRGRRLPEPLVSNMDRLLGDVLGQVLPLTDRPFALLGHSMGAVLAFELARLLAEQHERQARHLFVAACKAPSSFALRARLSAEPDESLVATFRRLDPARAARWSHPVAQALFLPVLRADLAACESYRFEQRGPLACLVSVFGGDGDPIVSTADLLGWAEVAAACQVLILPGDHYVVDSCRAAIARRVEERLVGRLSEAA